MTVLCSGVLVYYEFSIVTDESSIICIDETHYALHFSQVEGEGSSLGFHVKATCLGNRDFRVEVDNVNVQVSLATYEKV